MVATPQNRSLRRLGLHCFRGILFATIIALIHTKATKLASLPKSQALVEISIAQVMGVFPRAVSLASKQNTQGSREVFDATGELLGNILQTSPDSDHILGFSGPTNLLIALDNKEQIAGVRVLSSGDTRDHVSHVRQNGNFLQSFEGLTKEELVIQIDVDAVSGATLTSLAIQESIILRLTGGSTSLRFPGAITVIEARYLFSNADIVEQDESRSTLWRVFDHDREQLGEIVRTSPAADQETGYQGPTDAMVGVGPDGRVYGVLIRNSYDNEPYVAYVREDDHFLNSFNGLTIADIAKLDLQEAEVEGVSGATMTSMAVARGMILATNAIEGPKTKLPVWKEIRWAIRDLGTAGMILAGLVLGLTSLRSNRKLRTAYQLLLISYLGLINGDMISMAMIGGWAQNGVPWRNAGGLVLLTVAAFFVPLGTRRNIYCSHLCPHGAVQQLLSSRTPWRISLSKRYSQSLRAIPFFLLLWCVIVATAPLSFSLVDIEPFDAWVFRVAGWATISVAIVGLVASLFVPMAYCRYGCPTGAILGFLRFNSRSDRWSTRDGLAVGLLLLATGFCFF